MVVDDVHHHVHTNIFLDGFHHLAELLDPLWAVYRIIGGVRAFRNCVVERIIAPVEGVNTTDIVIQALNHRVALAVLCLQAFQGCFQRGVAGALVLEFGLLDRGVDFTQLLEGVIQVDDLGWVFVDGGDIKGWHQVHVRHTVFGQFLHMLDRHRVSVGKRHIFTAVCGWSGFIQSREVADVRFQRDDLGRIIQLLVWCLDIIPAFRLQIGIFQIDHLTELGVH